MYNPFGPQAESTEKLLAEAYGFDPQLDEDLKAQIDEEYERLLVLEGWPGTGDYTDPKTGRTYSRPALPWPSKARNLITQLYSDATVQKNLLDKVEEVLLSMVIPMIETRGAPGVLYRINGLGEGDHSGSVPRYFANSIGETKGDRFTISFMIPFILTPEARKVMNFGTPAEVQELKDSLIKTLTAMKPMMGGETLSSSQSIERQAESMCGLMHSVKPAMVANVMLKMAIPKKDFEEEDWKDVKVRLEKWK